MNYLFIVTLFLLNSCSHMVTGSSSIDNVSPETIKIEQTTNPAEDYSKCLGKVKIEYLKSDIIASQEMNSKNSSIPQGGRIIVHIFRPTEITANPNFFNYDVKINDKQVFSQAGSFDISYVSNPPSNHGPDGKCWRGLRIIDLNHPFQKGDKLQVFVLERLLRSDNFILTHK